ncbi:hypothetical protein [Brachybacterium sp. EE-P12]|uniref:hypothetical protein n=1 Tax=Brachybacterium sp. EE-P12 TaxID=2306299 RepID=UPI000F07AFFB|nr:hypothetical protein [Brachybacterium sp. EE-P12]
MAVDSGSPREKAVRTADLAPCPDCDGEGVHEIQVRVGQSKTPFGCLGCGGDGEVPAPDGGFDPLPWRHTSGFRSAEPGGIDLPSGGYTYLPRPGYSDYEDRYISTRSPEHASRMARADAFAPKGHS